jgi:hypothetical protein
VFVSWAGEFIHVILFQVDGRYTKKHIPFLLFGFILRFSIILFLSLFNFPTRMIENER